MKTSAALRGMTAALASLLEVPTGMAGSTIDLFVDVRPGNPCGGFTSLRAAINQARNLDSGTLKVIHLVSGTTFAIDGTTNDALTIAGIQNLELVADVADVASACPIQNADHLPPARLNAAGLGARRTLEVVAAGAPAVGSSVSIHNIDFINNFNTGAIQLHSSALTLRKVAFVNNTARVGTNRSGGGAIAVAEAPGLNTFLNLDGNVRFENNHAVVRQGDVVDEVAGGAIFCTGGAVVSALPQSNGDWAARFGDGTEAGGNTAQGSNDGGHGGAIGAYDCGIDLVQTYFSSNAAGSGGGIALSERRDLRFSIAGSVFTANRQTGTAGRGGAISISAESRRGRGNLEIGSSYFAGNVAAGDGGGLSFRAITGDEADAHGTDVHIHGSRFITNSAAGGGGALHLDSTDGPAMSVQVDGSNCASSALPESDYCMMLSDNVAGEQGAGLLARGSFRDSAIVDTAFLENGLIEPLDDAGSALHVEIVNGEADFALTQVLIDDPGGNAAAIAFDGEGSATSRLDVLRSTVNARHALLSNQQSKWANTLVIGEEQGDVPNPGADFKCSLMAASVDTPGLDLVTTPRGNLRPGSSSILRQHSAALFQPCSDADRVAELRDADLDGIDRPSASDIDVDAPDIGAFEFSDGRERVFANGFESTR